VLKAYADKYFNFKRFFVGEGPQAVPYLLNYRRVYILPTKQGLTFSILLFAMLVGSINYNNNLGYILTFLLASMTVVSIFLTYHNILFLNIGPAILKPVFAGKNSLIPVQIDNQHYSSRFAVEYYIPGQRHHIGDIPANNTTSVNLEINFTQRGMQAIPRFVIETTFPLGLFRAWAHIELQQSVLVYPQPAADSHLPNSSPGNKEGQNHQTVGNDDFDGLKNYQTGDSLYRIHWKSAARYQTLQTKHYIGAASDELWINWHDSHYTDIEQRLSQLTKWVLLAESTGIPYGFSIPGIEYALSTGLHHKNNCLQALALYGKSDV